MSPNDLIASCAASLRRGDRPVSVASYIESDVLKRAPQHALPRLRAAAKQLREGTETIEVVARALEELTAPPPPPTAPAAPAVVRVAGPAPADSAPPDRDGIDPFLDFRGPEAAKRGPGRPRKGE